MAAPAPASPQKAPVDEEATDLQKAYGMRSHATFKQSSFATSKKEEGEFGDEWCLVDYEPLKLSTFRIFASKRGTVVTDPILWFEQLFLFLIFVLCATPVYYFFKDEMGGKVSVRRFIHQQESKMRQFALIMTGLTTFLLSFYTSIIVARWWMMRTGGVGGIKAAIVDLEMLISQCCTFGKDEKEQKYKNKVLSAIRRYGRTSLMLIFMWRRKELPKPEELKKGPTKELEQYFQSHQLLTDDEHEEVMGICKTGHCLHETIWAWQAAIVNTLRRQDRIKSDQLYRFLLEKVTEGRASVQLCHTHLAVRVPMQYVHLLGLLVKMHNVVVCIIMGLLFGAAAQDAHYILCVQLFGRTCILPCLFNAILLVNCNLSDPFDGSESDFPGEIYQETLEKDCCAILDAANNLPPWIKDI